MTFFGGWRENMQLQARFVEDMTIPDGCVVSPSASLRKSWKLENSGETAWPLGCRLEIQAGNPTFGIQAESNQVGLPALQPGEYAVADVDVRAPAAPGRYTTYWRVCDPSGTQFGHRFWIDIVVAGSDEEPISACGVDAGIATGSDEAPSNNVDLTEATGSDDDSDNSSESGSDSSSDNASSVDDASEKSADEDEDSVADDDDDDDVEIVGVRAVETDETDQYRDALAMLASMGFADAAKNRRHLETAEGNVTDAVVSLLTE
jgi:next-to-BRCA1 protein 1